MTKVGSTRRIEVTRAQARRWIGRTLVGATSARRRMRGPLREGWSVEFEAMTRLLHHYARRSTRLPLSWQREALRTLRPTSPSRSSVRIEHLRAAGVPCAWFVPEDADPNRVLVYLHGGGYSIGSIESHALFISRLAQKARMRAFAVDYRLAPEHPFPAQLEDARRAWSYLLEEEGLDPRHVVIAGESAGGGLTLSTLIALRDEGAPLPAGAVVLSPWTDLTLSGPSIDANARFDFLPRRVLEIYVRRFMPDEDPAHPLASPLHADLSGLPPLLIQVGEAEALLDDSLRLAERARAAGVDTTLSVYPDMIHAFMLFGGIPPAQRAVREIADFVIAKTR